MHLPINFEDLLRRTIVESDRIEFKTDWNPESVLRTICAFANDFNNYGGGYIIIGIEEIDGVPMLPPKGISLAQIDKIQKDLVRIRAFLKPIYTLCALTKPASIISVSQRRNVRSEKSGLNRLSNSARLIA